MNEILIGAAGTIIGNVISAGLIAWFAKANWGRIVQFFEMINASSFLNYFFETEKEEKTPTVGEFKNMTYEERKYWKDKIMAKRRKKETGK